MHALDTHPGAEHVQLDLFRRASVARRTSLALSLSRTTMQLSNRAIREAFPEADEDELAVRFVSLRYGRTLADGLRQYLAARRSEAGHP